MKTTAQPSTPNAISVSPIPAKKLNGTPRLAVILLATGAVGCLVFPVSPAVGLIAGVIIAFALGNPVARTTSRVASWALKTAIVLLGAGMNLGVVWAVGIGGIGYTFAGLMFTLALGLWLGRKVGLSRDLTLLLSSGTAICGGSAIAAVSGVIRPKTSDVAVALAVVFLLNALALLIFPPIGHALGFSQEQFGLWAALAIHDTSSVAGAAASYGSEALGIAVTVKLARALWIVPLTIVVGFLFAPKQANGTNQQRFSAKRLIPPGFILGYLAMAACFTWVTWDVLASLVPLLKETAHRSMTLVLFLIGGGMSREALRQTGIRPLGIAVALWVSVSTLTATALLLGWIK